MLGLVKKGSEKTAKVKLSRNGNGTLSILDVKSPAGISTRHTKADDGYILEEIVIHTNNPDQPQIKVPVYAYVEG